MYRYPPTTILLILFCVHCVDAPAPVVGKTYLRPAYDPGSVTYAVLQDSSANMLARHLVSDLLSSTLRVRIEHTGRCIDIQEHYETHNARALDMLSRVQPVILFTIEGEQCFSYTIHYDLPLTRPLPWKYGILHEVPLRLSMIHPLGDFRHFANDTLPYMAPS